MNFNPLARYNPEDSVDFATNNAEFIALLKNSKIHVVAPASGISKEWLANLRSIHALNLYIPPNCCDPKMNLFPPNSDEIQYKLSLFHSNTEEMRYSYLVNALLDDSTDVVWALCGGYGSAKLIHKLKKMKRPEKEKFFIGYSDITALHIFLTQEWGWKTIHGSIVAELLKPDKDRANFVKLARIISGKEKVATIDGLWPLNQIAQASKGIAGKLVGGNLTLIEDSLATEWQIKTFGKIVFVEDVWVNPYQLDRALYHLKQAGMFDQVHALLFGSFEDDNEDIMDVLRDFARNLNIPVFKSNRFGHGKLNDPIIYNTTTTVIPSPNNQFKLIMEL